MAQDSQNSLYHFGAQYGLLRLTRAHLYLFVTHKRAQDFKQGFLELFGLTDAQKTCNLDFGAQKELNKVFRAHGGTTYGLFEL